MYRYKGDEPGMTARMGRAPRPFDPALCGTNQGLYQHRRDGIPKCEKCDAHEYAERKKNRRKADGA